MEQEDLLVLGGLLFPNDREKVKTFLEQFINEPDSQEIKTLLEEYEFDIDDLLITELLYVFGDNNQKLLLIDWRGEENEKEVEEFIEKQLPTRPDWVNATALRTLSSERDQRDGDFIIELFKAIDKDLEKYHHKLIFLNLGWDAYVLKALELDLHKLISERFNEEFLSSEDF
jgi:hypothetical protein